ncbi:MAG: hypothetical protein ACKOA8_10790 [Deltaproteobacteria bacterium]
MALKSLNPFCRKRILSVQFWLSFSLLCLTPIAAISETGQETKIAQKQTLALWPALPKLYRPFNWTQRTRDFTQFIFNWGNSPLPTIVWNRNSDFDGGPYAGKGGVFTIADFYGDQRIGYHNLFTNIAAVFSGSLVGLPMDRMTYANQTYNYVDQLSAYFNPTIGRLTLEPKANPGYSDWWYEVTANLLYFGLGELYKGESQRGMDNRLKSIADTYASNIDTFLSSPGISTYGFNHLGFDPLENKFRDVEPNQGFNYTDAGLGMGLIELLAYKKFGDPKYLASAKLALNYYDKSSDNKFYDSFAQFGPYLAARINAETGSHFSTTKYIDWVLEGNSAIGVFQKYQTDNKGTLLFDYFGASGFKRSYGQKERTYFLETTQYAFMLPAVKYDPSLALIMGKWMLHASTHASYFYPDQKTADSQAEGGLYRSSSANTIPYEALEIINHEGKFHFAESDPHRWKTDPNYQKIYESLGKSCANLSLYSGVWAGLWGGIIKNTNVPGILQLDTNKLDFYSQSYPTYLYYNPYGTARVVQIPLNNRSDLYDVITGTYLNKNQNGLGSFTIKPNGAVLLVVIPEGKTLIKKGKKTLVDNIVISFY